MEENGKEVESIRRKIQSKNPLAFSTKSKQKEEELSMEVEDRPSIILQNIHHIKGCNCKKSQCSNNY